MGHPNFIYVRKCQGDPDIYLIEIFMYGVDFIAKVAARLADEG